MLDVGGPSISRGLIIERARRSGKGQESGCRPAPYPEGSHFLFDTPSCGIRTLFSVGQGPAFDLTLDRNPLEKTICGKAMREGWDGSFAPGRWTCRSFFRRVRRFKGVLHGN